MAKKTSKTAQAPQSPVVSENPAPSQEGAANVGKTVDDVVSEMTKVQAQRAGLAGLGAVEERRKPKLRDAEAAYEKAARAVDQLQNTLTAKYPAAAGVFGAAKGSRRVLRVRDRGRVAPRRLVRCSTWLWPNRRSPRCPPPSNLPTSRQRRRSCSQIALGRAPWSWGLTGMPAVKAWGDDTRRSELK
jgi:hypothetical protein